MVAAPRRSARPGFTDRRGFLKTGGGGDSSVDGKIDHYRFNEAKWTAFRLPPIRPPI